MPTEIESVIYEGKKEPHWIYSATLGEDEIQLLIGPGDKSGTKSTLIFKRSRIQSIDATQGDSGELPWDIIGANSTALNSGMHEFVIHTDEVELSFTSEWPVRL